MVITVVGSGGKTTLIKKMASEYREQGKTVFVTTTTHMFLEEDTLVTGDPEAMIQQLKKHGYVMAGIQDGEKIRALPYDTYMEVCRHADIVLIEADGSKHMPLKYPNVSEPVIPDNAEEIIVVCGLNALGKQLKDVCHRVELVKTCLDASDETFITPAHIQKLLEEGYLKPLREKYPDKKIIAIFKAHTFSRVDEFKEEFATALNLADKAYVMDINYDREDPNDYPGVDAYTIIDLLENGDYIEQGMAEKLLEHDNAAILFMSSKEIYLLEEEYKKMLEERNKETNN